MANPPLDPVTLNSYIVKSEIDVDIKKYADKILCVLQQGESDGRRIDINIKENDTNYNLPTIDDDYMTFKLQIDKPDGTSVVLNSDTFPDYQIFQATSLRPLKIAVIINKNICSVCGILNCKFSIVHRDYHNIVKTVPFKLRVDGGVRREEDIISTTEYCKLEEFMSKGQELASKISSHINNKNNPHEVRANDLNVYTKNEVNTKFSELSDILVNKDIYGDTNISMGRKKTDDDGNTIDVGHNSTAIGIFNIASAEASHAEGSNTTASARCSHAEGQGTVIHANGNCQHVQGKYNVEDTEGRYADIVGGGTDARNRKNIYALDWQGNLFLDGDIYINGDTENGLSTKNYDNTTYSLTKNGTHIKLIGSDGSESSIVDSNDIYTLPKATNTSLGGVKTGDNITNDSGVISITKENIENALGYTPSSSAEEPVTYTLSTDTEGKLIFSDTSGNGSIITLPSITKIGSSGDYFDPIIGADNNNNTYPLFAIHYIEKATTNSDAKTIKRYIYPTEPLYGEMSEDDGVYRIKMHPNCAGWDGYVHKSEGQYNKVWKTDASGNPAWRDDANTTYSNATPSAAGLLSANDKKKLDGIQEGATNTASYSLPLMSSTARGGAKLGFRQSGSNFAVHIYNEQLYTYVPNGEYLTNVNKNISNIHSGTTAPSSTLGINGDVYFQYS